MRSFLSLALTLGAFVALSTAEEKAQPHECALDFKMKSIEGKTVDLHDYEGKVVLVVNTASKCGLTPQYAGLEALYKKYADQQFVVLGFPCNQFGGQEPAGDAAIAEFCTTKFDVTFPMFSKVEVNGDEAAPLYKHLTSQNVEPAGEGSIGWNFEKFLIGRDGKVSYRFAPNTAPEDAELLEAIQSELKKEK